VSRLHALLTVLLAVGVVSSAGVAAPLRLQVATDGNDGWSGTLARPNAARTDGPLATLAGARDALRRLRAAGRVEGAVRVEVQPGAYYLAEPFVLTPQDSGTEDAPVVYAAATAGQRPVISGGRVVTGWREEGPGLWVASVPAARGGAWPLRDLYVNGRRAVLARSPNEGYFRIQGKAGPIVDPDGKEQDSAKRAFRFKPGDLKAWDDLAGADLCVSYHWETALLPIQAVDEADSTVTLTGEMNWPFWSNQRYIVENTLAALDAPGEWYLDRERGRLSYRPRPGEDMRTAVVVAPRLSQLVLLSGDAGAGLPVANVRFEGLSFQHTNYVLEPAGHSDWQAAVTVNAAIEGNAARRCAIEDCEIAHLGNYAVWLGWGCQDNEVSHNHIHDTGAGGVKLGQGGIAATDAEDPRGNRVTDNLIHDLGYTFPGAVGVWVGQSSDNTIAHNEICDTYYTAISCGWTWGFGPSKAQRNTIAYNYLHDIGRGRLCDEAAIYTLGTSPGTAIRGNLIHDVWDWDEGYGAGGIYPDEGSSDIVIEDNVVYRTASGGLTVHYGRRNLVRNNIFALGRDVQVYLGRADMQSSMTFEHNIVYCGEGQLMLRESDLVADNNVYFRTDGEDLIFAGDRDFASWQGKGLDVHSVIADPKFVNAAGYDFRLQPDSPALKLGFQPIDTGQAGLTGPPELVQLARSLRRPPAVIPRRPEVPALTLDEGFENSAPGATADLATTWGEAGAAKVRVTAEVAAGGKQSLKFEDAPGLDQPWNPHLWYSPHQTEGTAVSSFDLRVEPGAAVWHEWRDSSSPYRVGPSLGVTAAGMVKVRDRELLPIPLSQWVHFAITTGLGKQATGTWELTVTVPGQTPQAFSGMPCDPKWKALEWMGFISNATDTAVFYLDNVKLETRKP
jgi:hypothetical protein